MSKVVKYSGEVRARGDRWQAYCPGCDAWHGVEVQVDARLIVHPGRGVRAAWDRAHAVIACNSCGESVDFLFTPEWRKQVLDVAEATR